MIPHLKRCLNDLLGRSNFKTPISVSSHKGVKYIRTPPEIRVESLRSLRGILRCHPKSACSKKMVSAELTFANRKIHTFYCHGRERRAWAGACDGSGLVGGRCEYFSSPPVFAGSLVLASPPTERKGWAALTARGRPISRAPR